MCGFAGVVVWDDRYRVSPETLRKMSARIAHRGPDGEGYHINHEEQVTPDRPQVALAFRRLAILDPDPRSNQPFTDGRHWLVFNGEIYNFRELRKELTSLRPDYQWRTTGDTEVLLAAYAQWGEKCVEHLNGMFAFAVWDEREKSLFLARDRMGQKPLFYAVKSDLADANTADFGRPHAIAFGSEIESLRPLDWISADYCSESVNEYLALGYISSPNTVYRDICKLGPAQRLRLVGTGGDIDAYFLTNHSSGTVFRDTVGETRRRVTTAVSRQLVSDVPLGCFLSGGIDSSVIAAAMKAALAGHPLHTFSISFGDKRYDESQYAAEVADHLGTRHFTFEVTPDASLDLAVLAEVFGEPFGDSSALPTHYLSRAARAHVKVALSGDGGDELFGGYDRYQAMRTSDRLPSAARAAVRVAAAGVPGTHPKSFGNRLRRFADGLNLDPAERYASYMRLFARNDLTALLRTNSAHLSAVAERFDAITESSQRVGHPLDVVQAALAVDRVTYLPNDLLTKLDRASMLHALEVRSPFMDHELVQFAAGLTTDQLLKGGPKRMLREAFKDDLPAWVFKRKKMGFAVPMGEWFRGELRPMLRDTLFAQHAFGRQHFNMKVVERLVDEHEQNRVDHSQRLYALLMLELWWNTVRT